jgi:hypothetical protein
MFPGATFATEKYFADRVKGELCQWSAELLNCTVLTIASFISRLIGFLNGVKFQEYTRKVTRDGVD